MANTQVYFWHGGREQGEWKKVNPSGVISMEETRIRIAEVGYVSMRVNPSIGPPVNPPADSTFRALGI